MVPISHSSRHDRDDTKASNGLERPRRGLRIEELRFQDRGPFHLVVEPRHCVSLTGPSGAGKTLFLRALADLDPHQGCVLLDDTESQSIPAPRWRKTMGFLPAESQWWYDTVGPHFPAGKPDGLHELGFEEDVMKWSISRLSTGERQRLAMLRLLANRPRALLLDEPTASLDSQNVSQAEELIARYRRATEASVLWVTHDSVQAGRVADRHFELRDGKLTEKYERS